MKKRTFIYGAASIAMVALVVMGMTSCSSRDNAFSEETKDVENVPAKLIIKEINVGVYSVRARGNADITNRSVLRKRLRSAEKLLSFRRIDRREAAAEKCQLHVPEPIFPRPGKHPGNLFTGSRQKAAGYTSLITEDAVVRAAQMRDKYGKNPVPGHHLPRSASAAFAAACSASFLLFPTPSAHAPL